MKIVVLNQMLQQYHKDKILSIANDIGAVVCFAESESAVPEEFATPHVAGNLTLKRTLDKNVDMFCEDLVNFAEGKTLKYAVDRRKGY